ncbi:alcohol dehydrogenase catalytic domain-containing protein [Mesorhizobium sp. CCNWLW179-1]|uniref:alcohol dehydrogenase catalytic domain-containing protein n=1 Tax=Mesorhizobium sp. CCNWLW179-1 TaxID=3136721 RepID=UPI0030149716
MVAVGKDVKRHKVGDHVAVGCLVDSCQHCDQCRRGEEQLCRGFCCNVLNSGTVARRASDILED